MPPAPQPTPQAQQPQTQPQQQHVAILDGVLERVTFSNPETGYTIARIAPDRGTGRGPVSADTELITAVGPLLGAQIGESLRLRGRWTSRLKYGRQFEVGSCTTVLPATEQGIRRYLGSGLIKGIGPVMAERMVSHFGAGIMHIIDDEPDGLVEVPGLGPKRSARIKDGYAYAVTTHRSQGSEYSAVVIPLTTAAWMMLQRNLLYTGITRAKKLVVLAGSRRAIAAAAVPHRRHRPPAHRPRPLRDGQLIIVHAESFCSIRVCGAAGQAASTGIFRAVSAPAPPRAAFLAVGAMAPVKVLVSPFPAPTCHPGP